VRNLINNLGIGSSDCRPIQEIVNKSMAENKNLVSTTTMRLFVADNYLDFEDIEEPIKAYLNVRMEYNLDLAYLFQTKAYVQRNNYSLNDGYFQLTEGEAKS
jgi:hypothetical protein